jgi:hypothetical protein
MAYLATFEPMKISPALDNRIVLNFIRNRPIDCVVVRADKTEDHTGMVVYYLRLLAGTQRVIDIYRSG